MAIYQGMSNVRSGQPDEGIVIYMLFYNKSKISVGISLVLYVVSFVL